VFGTAIGRGRLESVLAGLPFERREDDLFDEALHLGVDYRPREYPVLDELLSEAGTSLPGGFVERQSEIAFVDAAAAPQERSDPLAFARGRGGAQLALLKAEAPDLLAARERQRSPELLEKDPPQDLGQRSLRE
jgi:hypothetical protein